MSTVTVLPAGVGVTTASGESIVDALRRAGWRSPYRCRRGGCGACKARLVSGGVAYAGPVADSVLSPDDRAAGLCLPCRAVPTGDVVIEVDAPLRAVLATVGSAGPRPAPPEQEGQ